MDKRKVAGGVAKVLLGAALAVAGGWLVLRGARDIKEGLTVPAKAEVSIEEKQSRAYGDGPVAHAVAPPVPLARTAFMARLAGAALMMFGHQAPRAVAAREIGAWEFTHKDAAGRVIWHAVEHNALVDVGEQRLLEIYFRDATEPGANEYLSLSDSTNPCSAAETDSLATANAGEPSTNGYARQTITRDTSGWPTSALDAGDWQITSTTETFSASGGSWGPVNCAVLQTSADNTGDFLAFVALSQARTLADGETLDVSLKIKLQ